jgi:hypothetical protein
MDYLPRFPIEVHQVTLDYQPTCLAWLVFPRLGKIVIFDASPGQRIHVTYVATDDTRRRKRRHHQEIFYSYAPTYSTVLYLSGSPVNRTAQAKSMEKSK